MIRINPWVFVFSGNMILRISKIFIDTKYKSRDMKDVLIIFLKLFHNTFFQFSLWNLKKKNHPLIFIVFVKLVSFWVMLHDCLDQFKIIKGEVMVTCNLAITSPFDEFKSVMGHHSFFQVPNKSLFSSWKKHNVF